uniref:SWIM-type domain-containing protein n=1 Tax=Arundo donax TaxID=35708 RepID=A0A0A9DCM2_ARUDO
MAKPYDPEHHVYSVRAVGGTNPGGERYGGRNYRVNLTTVECTCMTPQLLHVPCSHMIIACKSRGVCHTSPDYMAPLYSKVATLRTWESRFEPFLDPTQLPDYNGEQYVPDSELIKLKKGRRKKKRLHGEMDEANGYGLDMYGTGDFNQDPLLNLCSVCHKTGHRKEQHMKRRRKKRGSRRRGNNRSRLTTAEQDGAPRLPAP